MPTSWLVVLSLWYPEKCCYIFGIASTMNQPACWPLHSWWRHQRETFSALLAMCAGNSPASGEFPTQRPVKRSFAVFFDLCLNKRLRKQSWGWWFETLSHPSWRHCNVVRYLLDRVVTWLRRWLQQVGWRCGFETQKGCWYMHRDATLCFDLVILTYLCGLFPNVNSGALHFNDTYDTPTLVWKLLIENFKKISQGSTS